jgi:ssDNA-binding Zn-finger/Zn-ribbon topoisomerase 1
MKRAIILKGKPFDWEEGKKNLLNVVREDGSINWRAASKADPGVMHCPICQLYLWREGEKVKCPDCHSIFNP